MTEERRVLQPGDETMGDIIRRGGRLADDAWARIARKAQMGERIGMLHVLVVSHVLRARVIGALGEDGVRRFEAGLAGEEPVEAPKAVAP